VQTADPSPSFLKSGPPIAFSIRMPDERNDSLTETPHSSRRWIVFAVLGAVLAGAAAWYWASRSDDASAHANPATEVRSTLHLESFVLNLADADHPSYLRVGIDLGLNREPKHGEEIPTAQLRDTILTVLGEAKVDDLLTAAGKVKLKENLLHALQERAPQMGIEEVYFTEFLIQR
jgi:flagellar FliL protein